MKPWFAWYPVNIDNKWVWLRTVERERHHAFLDARPFGDYPSYPVSGYWVYKNVKEKS